MTIRYKNKNAWRALINPATISGGFREIGFLPQKSTSTFWLFYVQAEFLTFLEVYH